MLRTILLVDDSSTFRGIIRACLGWQQFNYREATGVRHAIQSVWAGGIDLVICDLQMQGLDGHDFARMLRAETTPWIREMPLILLTASKTPGVREKSLAAGASAFLEKPFKSSELIQEVDRLLAARASAKA